MEEIYDLFSIILVLSIFYISMNENKLSDFVDSVDTTDTSLVVNESTELVALRVQSDEEVLETINSLQDVLLSETADVQSKNDAYNELLLISSNKSLEEKLEKIIKEEFKFDSFIKINNANVTVVIEAEIKYSSKEEIYMKNILTKREKEVFDLLIQNYNTVEIARALMISEKTVRNHISNVIQKLGVSSRGQAVIELLKLNEIKL